MLSALADNLECLFPTCRSGEPKRTIVVGAGFQFDGESASWKLAATRVPLGGAIVGARPLLG